MAIAEASTTTLTQPSLARDREDEESNKRQRRKLLKIRNEELASEGLRVYPTLPPYRF